MTGKQFHEALDHLDPLLIEKYYTLKDSYLEKKLPAVCLKKKRQSLWIKWSTVAVSICLIIGIAIPIFQPKGGPGQNDPLRPLNVIEYNGAYYECVDMDNADILGNYNLPHEITSDMIGTSLGSGWGSNGKQTKQIFYQYIPYADVCVMNSQLNEKRTQQAVYIVEEDGAYSFALFCNYIGFDSNTHTEASEMFAVYGVDAAEDIAIIKIDEKEITDIDTLNKFFSGLCDSYSMGNDDYQDAIFKGMSEKEQQLLNIELADSMVQIQIITVDGVVINHIEYYPTINYIYWANNYYRFE